MFSKIICVFAAVACVAYGQQQAAQFPAGVDPALCPSYPNCDNAYLHNPQQQQQQQWNPQPQQQQQWNAPAPQWNAAPQEDWTQWDEPSPNAWNPSEQQNQWNAPAQNQWNAPAPNQWNDQNQWNAPAVQGPSSNHLPGAGGDKFPAGVNPQSCPNYPYCDNNPSVGHGGARQVAPLPGWTERVYPAGVSAHDCPNYPLCN